MHSRLYISKNKHICFFVLFLFLLLHDLFPLHGLATGVRNPLSWLHSSRFNIFMYHPLSMFHLLHSARCSKTFMGYPSTLRELSLLKLFLNDAKLITCFHFFLSVTSSIEPSHLSLMTARPLGRSFNVCFHCAK